VLYPPILIYPPFLVFKHNEKTNFSLFYECYLKFSSIILGKCYSLLVPGDNPIIPSASYVKKRLVSRVVHPKTRETFSWFIKCKS